MQLQPHACLNEVLIQRLFFVFVVSAQHEPRTAVLGEVKSKWRQTARCGVWSYAAVKKPPYLTGAAWMRIMQDGHAIQGKQWL